MRAFVGCVGSPDAPLAKICRAVVAGLDHHGTAWTEVSSPGSAIAYSQASRSDIGGNPVARVGDIIVVGDARLDNASELVTLLGHSDGSLSNIELIASLWLKHGEATLDRLLGDFALAIWLPAQRSLTLVRDPTGERPVFYRQMDGIVAFASMPAALADIGRPDADRLNRDRLAASVRGHSDNSDATNFLGVRRILPGAVVTLRSGSVQSRHYWDPPTSFLELSDEDFAEAYASLLREAVGPRLARSGGNLGAHLSSGWDSSCVAATAARLGGNPLALTSAPRFGFDGPVLAGREADESHLAAVTARALGIEHQTIRPQGSPLTKLRRHHRLYQEPDRNIVNMQWWSSILESARDQDISVMLTGQIGNLTVNAGGLTVLAEYLRSSPWRWAREAQAVRRASSATWKGVGYNSMGRWFPDWLSTRLEWLAGRAPDQNSQNFLRREWRARANDYSRSVAVPRITGRPYAERLQAVRSQDNGVFRLGAFAESGIEERDPLADRRLIDFSFQVPPDQLLRHGRMRPMARRALEGLVPSEVLDTPRRGYQGADWFERMRRQDLHDLLDEIAASNEAQDLLDVEKMRATIDRWPTAGTNSLAETVLFRSRLLHALSVGTFIQEFSKASP